MSPKIFVALSTFAQNGHGPLTLLKNSGLAHALNPFGRRLNRDEIVQLGQDCSGVIAGVEPYDEYVLSRLPKLRCISRCGAGLDNIALDKAKEMEIEIRNTPCVVIQPVVEFTVALIFDLLKKISHHAAILRSKRWEKKSGHLLAGKTVGVLGLGRIGKKVAEVMRKLDSAVYGADLAPDLAWAARHAVTIVSVSELLRISDILCIHLSIDQNHPFRLGTTEISSMKPGAWVVNVSRGQVVDEDALYEALRSGRLGGAALDVFEEEPYTGKLCELENAVLTPHIATLTEESRLEMEMEATQNVIDYFNSRQK